jgi:hypothetical protein
MTTPVAVGDLFQGGRVATPDPNLGKSFLRFASVLTTDLYEFHFPTGSATTLTFGVPQSVFIDNSFNSFELQITVMGTRQTFPVPANSTGWYSVDALPGSTVNMQSAGVPAGPVEVIFYNYPQNPFVYYKFGLSQVVTIAIPNGADIAQGDTADPPVTDPSLPATVISVLKGILTGINNLLLTSLPFSHAHINTSATTPVKAAPGILGGVNVNTAGTAGLIEIFDSLSGSGALVASFDSTVTGSFQFGGSKGVAMAIGITVVTTGAPDISILYK